jgi:arsenate reductase
MKTVLFSGTGDEGRQQLATAIFNSLRAPAMVKAISAPVEGSGEFRPEVNAALQEIGLDASEVKVLSHPSELLEVHLLVTFGADPIDQHWPRARHEDWTVPSTAGQPLESVRRIRDQISKKVWRLIAKEGWYRLQPASAIRFKPAAFGALDPGAAFRAS